MQEVKFNNFVNFYNDVMGAAVFDDASSAKSTLYTEKGNEKLRELRTALVENRFRGDIEGPDSRDVASNFMRNSMQGFREAVSNVWHNDNENPETKKLQQWLAKSAKQNEVPLRELIAPEHVSNEKAVVLAWDNPSTLKETFAHNKREVSEGLGIKNPYTRVFELTERAMELEHAGKGLPVYRTHGQGRTVFKMPGRR